MVPTVVRPRTQSGHTPERPPAWKHRGLRRGVYLAITVVLVVVLFNSREGLARFGSTFLDRQILAESLPPILEGFWMNVRLFMVAEALVLVWGLVVALARSAPGPEAAPLRWLAIGYLDLFRGLPALVTIYLIGFGLPLTGLPVFRNLSLFSLGVLALTLIYGAYVAEVYRAGIESVHWSQTAAARSLGLSHRQTMRFVVIPQAVRRIIPPLLNDFICLQKDTTLVSLIGVLEGFNRARIFSGNRFNLSPVVGLGLCFVIITIPMARLTDRLIEADQRKMRAAG
ncbi:MAG TPA: amino acid ABC transporter permease [Actinomycetota bacterium]|nr:amino acid ABC transporter permease [Actinomycetota bacterium]